MKDDLVDNDKLSVLRTVATFVVVAGTIGSVYFTLHAGRNNHSILLPLLFVIWVLSPFIILLIANVISKRWMVHARMLLYILMLIITIGSLVSYSGVLTPSGTKPAAVFLFVPLISWIFISTTYLIIKFKKAK
ncbi:MAG TPA: hypothetical protein VK711_16125 [Puia sp.]|nr:hypothetical protein [Puia sp.]